MGFPTHANCGRAFGGNGSILMLDFPTLLHWDGAAWGLLPLEMSDIFDISQVWPVATQDLWLISDGIPWRWIEGAGTDMNGFADAGLPNDAEILWRSTSGSVYVPSGEQVLRWSPGRPTWMPLPTGPTWRARDLGVFGYRHLGR